MTTAKEKEKFVHKLALKPGRNHNLKLSSGSSVAVIGGGPAGSFFSLFLLDLAKRIGLEIVRQQNFIKTGFTPLIPPLRQRQQLLSSRVYLMRISAGITGRPDKI